MEEKNAKQVDTPIQQFVTRVGNTVVIQKAESIEIKKDVNQHV